MNRLKMAIETKKRVSRFCDLFGYHINEIVFYLDKAGPEFKDIKSYFFRISKIHQQNQYRMCEILEKIEAGEENNIDMSDDFTQFFHLMSNHNHFIKSI